MSVAARLAPLLAEGTPRPGGEPILDLLGEAPPASTGRVQDLMLGRALPVVYERLWRPAWSRILLAPLGGMAGERRAAETLLALRPGDRVLDVGCGPGNFTRGFAATVGGQGLAVGLDASRPMLERAVRDTPPDAIAWVRGDAEHLPFADATFDAVCCFAALHLMRDPWAALAELVRVLAPGGRIALLTSARRVPLPVDAVMGLRLLGTEEVTGRLRGHGLQDVGRRLAGGAQVVGGRRPG